MYAYVWTAEVSPLLSYLHEYLQMKQAFRMNMIQDNVRDYGFYMLTANQE